jgi:hypothetical protein
MYAAMGSDWVFERVSWMSLQLLKWSPAAGASYLPLRGLLATKKACINVKNEGVDCFEMSLLAALYPAKDHVDKASQYKRCKGRLNMSMFPKGELVPADPELLKAFERANNTAVTVLFIDQSLESYEDPTVLYQSVFAAERDPIQLLLEPMTCR